METNRHVPLKRADYYPRATGLDPDGEGEVIDTGLEWIGVEWAVHDVNLVTLSVGTERNDAYGCEFDMTAEAAERLAAKLVEAARATRET